MKREFEIEIDASLCFIKHKQRYVPCFALLQSLLATREIKAKCDRFDCDLSVQKGHAKRHALCTAKYKNKMTIKI